MKVLNTSNPSKKPGKPVTLGNAHAMTSRGNYASTSKLKPLNATGSLKLSPFIAEIDPRKLKANFASTTAPGGDIFAVGEPVDKICWPKSSKASDGKFRTGGILKTYKSNAS